MQSPRRNKRRFSCCRSRPSRRRMRATTFDHDLDPATVRDRRARAAGRGRHAQRARGGASADRRCLAAATRRPRAAHRHPNGHGDRDSQPHRHRDATPHGNADRNGHGDADAHANPGPMHADADRHVSTGLPATSGFRGPDGNRVANGDRHTAGGHRDGDAGLRALVAGDPVGPPARLGSGRSFAPRRPAAWAGHVLPRTNRGSRPLSGSAAG